MPPRRSTRSTASQSNSRRRRSQDEDDIIEEDQPAPAGDEQQQNDDEEDQPARRSTRRTQRSTSTRTSTASASSSRRKASTSSRTQGRSRRGAHQEDEEEEEEEVVEDEDPDVTATSSRRSAARGRQSTNSIREADDDPDDDGVGQWKLLPRPPQIEISDQARKAAKKAGKQEILRKSAELCRMALYHEYSKGPLRRAAISQQLFQGDVATSRSLPMIMRYTNKTLRGTFAMELAEIKTGATAASTAYILRSVLPPAAVAVLTKPSKDLGTLVKGAGIGAEPLDKGKKRARSSGQNDVNDHAAQSVEAAALAARKSYVGQRTYDAAAPPLDWKAADGQLGSMGLLYVVLALILTNGRTLPNAQLRSQLRRLCLPPGEPLPIGLRIDGDLSLDAPVANHSNLINNAPRSSATEANLATIESFLATAVKMHYLEYAKSSTLAGGTQQAEAAPARRPGRRSTTGGGNGDEAEEEAAFDWKWGPRAHVEVGEVAIGKFMAELWTLGASREDEEEEADAAAVAAASQAIDAEQEDEGEDDDDDQPGSSRRRGKKKAAPRKSASQKTAEQRAEREARLMRDIERAAGSQLT
ncbi:hypothetical protein OC845_001271 [Tilletia horrida]|nr:hypothetical protein OC845_001271 [Tilletia horrida]